MKTLTKFLLLALMSMVYAQTIAQETNTDWCPSDDITDALEANDPNFLQNLQNLEEAFQINSALPIGDRTETLYSLPVVIHVIHKGEPYGQGSNITDDQIISAMTAINNDYRHVVGTNGYGSGVDVEIEFCLASRDPNGNPTTGINRVNGSGVPLYSTEGIEATGSAGADETAVKALSTWPRASYINVWIVSEIENNDAGAGVQGYAYFPFNSPLDGIVIMFNAFGTTGNLKSYTNLNRTFSHEMGHYLGLYHTFYDTTTCGAESSCSTQGDRVCDTPVTILNTLCSTPACSGTQQIQNYMDYTGQACQNMFTDGQKLRMRTTLETQRSSMLTSLGCMPVFTRDAGITAVLSPNGSSCNTSYQPVATLTNFGSTTLTSVSIVYNIDGVGSTTYSWTGSLSSGSFVNVTLPTITAAMGAHTLYIWTNNPNAQSDQNTSNDQSTSAFTVAEGSAVTLDVQLDYAGDENTWQITDINGAVIDYGGPFQTLSQGVHIIESICLPTGCYNLTFYDSYGDGQGFTNGQFTLTNSTGTVLAYQSGNWGAQSVNNFCVTAASGGGSAPVASFTISDPIVCIGQAVTYTSTSTNSPTSYSWTFEAGSPSTSTLQNPSNITYATAGVYDITLTATNSNGSNTYTCTNCITVTGAPTVTLTPTNPLCYNSTNGAVNSAVSGAYNPFVYSWNTGATTSAISNVAPGTYTVTVTDQQGCIKTASTTLSAPAQMTINGTVSNSSCNGANTGSISLTVTGGTGSKSYSWNTGATASTISNLDGGSYTVIVTDANSCTKTQSFTVIEPAVLVANQTDVDITCSSSTGSAQVAPTGGTSPYTFTWSNGATGNSVSNLAAGSYSVTVTDSYACTVTSNFVISASANFSISLNTTNIACAGVNSGAISVNTNGALGPFTYAWSNGSTAPSMSSLAPGTYNVVVTNGAGCTSNASTTLSSPPIINLSVSKTDITCNGLTNGTAQATATGGTGNLSYQWSTGASGSNISNLAVGNYSVTVTDANGCTKTQSIAIAQPALLAANLTDFDISCGSTSGSALVAPSGGTAPYSILWSNGATSTSISNLSVGNYTVAIIDSGNCAANGSFTITQAAALTVSLATTPITCIGANNATISVNTGGAIGPFTYLWNTGSTAASQTNVAPGTYTITVSNSQGCSGTATTTIANPPAITLAFSKTDVSCFGMLNGTASVQATGGTGAMTFVWSNGATGASINGLAAGNYNVTATDANGCNATSSIAIAQPAVLNVAIFKQDISCFGLTDGNVSASVSGGSGPMNYNWSNGASTSSISELSQGQYTLTVTDANGCSVSENIWIQQPSMLVANTVVIAPESCDGSDGSAVVNIMGGTGTYTIVWNTGDMTPQIENVIAGTYDADIHDSNGCSLLATIDIPYECVSTIPQTRLVDGDCGAMNLPLNASVSCIPVVGATMYQWRFINLTGQIISEEYSISTVFALQQVPGLQSGQSLQVLVRALVASEWGAYGELCSISIEPALGTTQLIDEDCGSTIIGWGETVYADIIPNALNYEWHFTADNYEWTSYTTDNSFVLDSTMLFEPGLTYNVQIRCAMGGGVYTQWGAICPITFDMSIGIDENSFANTGIIIYPNPNDGQNIIISSRNLEAMGDVERLEVYTASGHLVEIIPLLNQNTSTKITHSFSHPLASGIYVIRYDMNGKSLEEKFIVN